MEKIDLLLNEYVSNPKGWRQWLKNKNEIIEELNNIFPQVENLNEKIYWIKNNLNSYPKCPICGNEIKKWKGRNKGGYFKFCSCKCAQVDKNTRDKIKNTCLEKYGVDNAAKAKDIQSKMKNTCLKKYGVTCPLYGEEAKNKTKQTNLKRYGCENGGGSIKAQEKIKNTLLNHFGVDSYSKTEKFKNYMHVLMSSEEMQQKIYNTQKKNNSFNKSKSEDLAFELLKKKYPDIIHHYKDNNRYPFCCDFYIPSLDLFIECQFGMYHNKRPYIGDFNDLNEIELLKEKSKNRKKISGKDKSRYDSVIYTWSILDPKKRKIAKQNKLNFIEFWNIEELKKWINETDKRYI